MSTLSNIAVELDFNSFDPGSRMVVGYATLNNLDKGDDIITLEASVKALEDYRGNIRIQHDKSRPVGIVKGYTTERVFDSKTGLFFDGLKIAVYISKSADDVLDMCDEGVLNGFSVQGQIISSHKIFDPELQKEIRIIDEYKLNEISLVDSPANPLANINSVFKSVDSLKPSDNIMICNEDEIIIKNNGTMVSNCPNCKGEMTKINNDDERYQGLFEKLEGGQTQLNDQENVVEEVVDNAEVSEEAVIESNDVDTLDDVNKEEIDEVNSEDETPVVENESVETLSEVNDKKETPSDEENNSIDLTGAVEALIARLDSLLAEKAEEVTAKSADTDGDLVKSLSDLVSKVDSLAAKMDSMSETLSKIDEIDETAGAMKKSLDEQVLQIRKNEPKSDYEIFKGAFGGK